MSFLQETVYLVDCTITVGPFNVDICPRSPIHHTTLEKLTIRVLHHPDNHLLGSLILPYLDLPSLRKFKWETLADIHRHQHAPEWPITTLLESAV